MRPFVSVVVPIYDVSLYLRECLESLCRQTLTNIEIILVDDCSPDSEDIQICDEFLDRDSRFKLVRHEVNLGLGGARNSGIDYSCGEYVFFLDSDDYIRVDALKLLYDAAVSNNAVVVSCNSLCFDTSQGVIGEFKHDMRRVLGWNFVGEKYFELLDRVAWNKLYRKDIFTTNPEIRFTPHLIHEDVEFYWRIFTVYQHVFVIFDELYFYRQRSGSIMTKAKDKQYYIGLGMIMNSIVNILENKQLGDFYWKCALSRFDSFVNLTIKDKIIFLIKRILKC